MPIYEYGSTGKGCEKCSAQFSQLEDQGAPPLTHCPACANPIERVFSLFSIKNGKSQNPSAPAPKEKSHNHDCAKAGCHSRAKTLVEKKFGK